MAAARSLGVGRVMMRSARAVNTLLAYPSPAPHRRFRAHSVSLLSAML